MYYTKKMIKLLRIALVGDGPTATSHVLALKSVGLEVHHCSANPSSKTVDGFAKKHNIANVWPDPIKLIKASDEVDALVIAVSINVSSYLLSFALESGKPVLIEKPVATGTEYLSQFRFECPDNVIIGYNRRFFSSIQTTKKILDKSVTVACANLQLPETIDVGLNFQNAVLPVYENSCHGLDILFYLFPGLKIKVVEGFKKNGPYFGRYVLLENDHGSICSLFMIWNAPANFSLSIELGENRIDLTPFEILRVYNQLEIEEPTKEFPARRYYPRQIEYMNVHKDKPNNVKPGYHSQALEFKKLIYGTHGQIAANLTDAFNVQKMLTDIIYHNN